MALFTFQFLHSNTVYFGFKEEFKEDRGIVRIFFPGAGVFFLAYFISLNKSSKTIKWRWVFIIFLILGLIVTVLQVTRQSIAFLLIVGLFHYMKKASIAMKIVVLASFIGIVIYFLNSDIPISRGLAETQKETVSSGDQYIRLLSADYFLNDFSPNSLSRIFGNGFPNNSSNYGKFVTNLQSEYGYYFTDVGLIGFYALFGIFPIIAYLIIFIKSLIISIPEEYYYLKYYMWFLMITSLTSDNLYSINFMITNVFVLYSYQLIYEQQKANKLTRVKITPAAQKAIVKI